MNLVCTHKQLAIVTAGIAKKGEKALNKVYVLNNQQLWYSEGPQYERDYTYTSYMFIIIVYCVYLTYTHPPTHIPAMMIIFIGFG